VPTWDSGCAAEFARPDDERVVEQAAALEVGDEGHAGAVDFGGFLHAAFLHAVVVASKIPRIGEAA
jgi:hypothetical protein